MGKSSSSKSPDVVGAARETGKQAKELQREQTFANRPDQYNPWGSTKWSTSVGADGMTKYTQNETFNPALQSSLDSQLGVQQARSGAAGDVASRLGDTFSQPMDFDQFGGVIGFDPSQQRGRAEDAAYGRSTSRLDPQFEQQAKELEINLRNKGLRAGDSAYDAQMETFGRTRNDAYEQARMGATLEGRSETELGLSTNDRANALRRQEMEEALLQRGLPLEEINRLMQGQEIEGSTPSMQEKATIADKLGG